MHTTDTETRVSSPLESPQFLHRIYRDSHGETHTLAVREHVGATWGPERLLVLEPAENVGARYDHETRTWRDPLTGDLVVSEPDAAWQAGGES